MAFFPASPTNGQQATVGNIVYQWNSTSNVWNRVGTTVVQLVDGALVTITGNLLVTGSGSSQFSGNLISLANVVVSNNVVATRGVFSGNVSGSNLSTTGNVLSSGNIVTPNLYVTRIYGNGQFSTSGTVTAASYEGSSIPVTGNVTTNNNVVALANVNSGGDINATGNVNATNIVASGNLTVSGNVSGNTIISAAVLTNNTVVAGNVSATYFLGNGALLTGVVTGGGGAGNRANASISTGSIANSATFTGNVTLAKGYAIYKVTTSTNAWVRLYSNTVTQSADSSRSMFNDPQPGAGVMVEIISTGANVVLVSPAAVGWNDSSPVSNSIPVSITNLSGTSSDITVTFTYLGLEL